MRHRRFLAVALGAVTAAGVHAPTGYATSQPDGDSALTLFARGVVSTDAPEFATTLTPGVNRRWQSPTPVSFGSVIDAGNPAIAPSGRFVVMVRVVTGGGPDLFVSCRAAGGWAEPQALSTAVNTPFADFAPSIDAVERFLYFTSERPGVVAAMADGARPPGDVYRIGLDEAGIRCP